MDYPNGTITPLASLDGKMANIAYLVPPITRETSGPTVLDVLNSARPAAPKVLYVIPTFTWTASGQPNGTNFPSPRKGNGLRIYLDRPWWSSGEGELLGVVLSGGGTPTPDNLKPYVTQWGTDPVFRSVAVPNVPTLPAFKLATVLDDGVSSQLSLDELPGVPVQVAGHPVSYDPERRLWYCDLEIDAGSSYFPFVRLALAQYQPTSVKDAHLSRVVLADFAQLTPGRTVSVVRNSTRPPSLDVTVSGLSYQQVTGTGGPSRVEVSFEQRWPDGDPTTVGELAWSPVPNLTTTPLVPITLRGGTLWQATLALPSSKNDLRLVIKEFELYSNGGVPPQRRLVFADTVQITGPIIS
ncbi:MAG TPA: hypothetical protein VFZ25_03745 [Chloroflexota bacterium]|nr:hypothetical protein [Chloroflexota bacterium]